MLPKSSPVSQAFVTLHLPFPVIKSFLPSFSFFSIIITLQLPLLLFAAAIAAIIPAAATSAALIYVGVLMLMGLKNVDFDDMDQMLPVSLMLIGMPVSGSIGHAIGLGLISYTVIKVFAGKAKDVSVLTYVISALFLVKFFVVV